MISRAERELQHLDQVFKALAHATRRHVLVVLAARGGEMTAGKIAERFDCAWPTMSRHLRILEDAGLVQVERDGRMWMYTLDRERLGSVAGDWIDWFNPKREEQ